MFRKPKRKAKQTLRKKEEEEEGVGGTGNGSDDDPESTSELLSEARKRIKGESSDKGDRADSNKNSVMHSYSTSAEPLVSAKDLVTSTAQHHGIAPSDKTTGTAEKGADGIFRDQSRNKFHAGPIRAAQHVRVTARFDYQPDICKDYKETGFCGFGDTCIYLHDRGDTMAGWQIEQQWEEEQKMKREKQEKIMSEFMDGGGKKEPTKLPEDGLPFACHICRNHFTDPVVTTCSHYFCQKCVFQHVRENDLCPLCGKDMNGVFNEPTKLVAKKRKILGIQAAKAENSWEAFLKAFTTGDTQG